MNKLQPVQGLWVGNKLGAVEQISIKSFMAYGHPYHLYTYEEVENVPEGVEIKDANEIIPAQHFYTGRVRSYGPFSDWFRWVLMQKKGGIYMDLDMFALRPMDLDAPVIMCYEVQYLNVVCGAVLKVPSKHPLVTELVKRCNNPRSFFIRYLIIFNMKKIRKLFQYNSSKKLLAKITSIKDMFVILFSTAWCMLLAYIPKTKYNSKEYQRYFTDGDLAGPAALTSTSKHNIFRKLKKSDVDDLKKYILPEEKFFPVRPDDFHKLLKSGCQDKEIENMFPDSYTVHIWTTVLRWHGVTRIQADSYIGLMAKKYDVDL